MKLKEYIELNEERQGVMYHKTELVNLLNILETDKMNMNKENNKTFFSVTRMPERFDYGNSLIEFNMKKLSHNNKIEPFNWMIDRYVNSSPRKEGYDEAEERVIANKKNMKNKGRLDNVSKYINNIFINTLGFNDRDEKRLEKVEEICKKKGIKIKSEMVRKISKNTISRSNRKK